MFSLATIVFVVASALGAPSEKRALVAKALSEPTQITLENIRLVDAICKITDQTGVKIEMSPQAMWYVPQGPETIIQKVAIANVPLREGLTRLFDPLGMKFELSEDSVRIIPKDAVLCLGRAPTWVELKTLSEISATQPGLKSGDMDKLQDRVQFKVPSPDPWGALSQVLRNVGAGPGDEVLSAATSQLGWTWCLADDHIVVGTYQQLLRQRLKQPLSIRIANRPLIDVLQEIGNLLNTPVRVEPGAFQTLPLQVRTNYFLDATNKSAEQVIEGISANTGLGYVLSPDGIMFYSPSGPAADMAKQAPSSSGSADPYVGKIVIDLGDGKTFEWMIRRSELPEDLKQIRDNDISQAIEDMRQRRITNVQP